MSKYMNIPIFVPHEGCNHECVFCNQRHITGQTTSLQREQIITTIEEHLSTARRGQQVEIAFFGGSFTGIPRKRQEEYLEIAKSYLDNGLIQGIRLSTRPDYINEKILYMLKQYGVTTIELGVQSLDERVLVLSKRGHAIEDVIRASNLIKYFGFTLGLQMMIGLPGDSFDISLETAEKIISLKPDFVRIYPTIVVKNTELCQLYQTGKYAPMDLDEAVEITAEVVQLFMSNGIDVIRVGLQPSEGLLSGEDLVAGPFHPSFNHLVKSQMFRNALEDMIIEKRLSNELNLVFRVNPKDISNAVGHKRANMIYLKERYPQLKIRVLPDELVMRDYFAINEEDYPLHYSIF